MTNPQNVQAKIKMMLTAMGRWNNQTSGLTDAVLLAVTANKKPDALTGTEWNNIMAELAKSTSKEELKEAAVASIIANIVLRLDTAMVKAAADAAAIAAANKALSDRITAIHAALKASVEGHTELGVQTYAGPRRDWVTGILTQLREGKQSLTGLATNVPGASAEYYVNVEANIRNAWTTQNDSNLIELLDNQLMYLYPFKTYASGVGTTETIELKQKVGDVGPGTKVFFWMLNNLDNTTYGWEIDGVEVDAATFKSIHDAWVSAAAATDTAIEAGNQGLINAGEGIVEAVKDAVPTPEDMMAKMMATMIAMIMPIVIMGAVLIGAIILGVWLYKKYKKGDFKDIESSEWVEAAKAYNPLEQQLIRNYVIKDAVKKNPEVIALALQTEGVPAPATKLAISQVDNLPQQAFTPMTAKGKEAAKEQAAMIPSADAIAGQMLQGGMVPGMGGGGMGGGMPGMPPMAPPAGAPVQATNGNAVPVQPAGGVPAQNQNIDPQQAMQIAKLASSMA